jgi:predicted permease
MHMENPIGAIRYAIRQFQLAPIFTASAILTLSLGIGGTTAIFTLIHAVMLRSLPVTDPESLYRVGDGDNCCVNGGTQGRWGLFSFPLFERLKAEAPEFDQMTAFQAGGSTLSVRRPTIDSAPRPLRSEYVTGNYFTTFGISAFGGRLFTAEDDKPSAPPVVVLSHHAWQATYGGEKSMVGATLVIEGHPFTVSGVAPPGFFGDTLRNNPPDIWIPIQQEPMIAGGNTLLRQPIGAWLRVIGRLKPGASIDGVAPRLTGVLRQWIEHDSGYPSNWLADLPRILPKQTLSIVPAGAGVGIMKEQYASSLQLLMTVCGLVLLIACANVANLLLARGVARRTQTAVRMAIGASRAAIVTQALIESVLLAIAGGIAGLAVAVGAARLLLSLAFSVSTFLPINPWPSPLVLAFAFSVSIVTGVVFGAVPAWLATRTDPIDALRGSGRSTGDHSSMTRTALLVVQATLSVVLVAGATMLGRSLSNVENQDFGFDVRDRVLVGINRPPATYTVPQLMAKYRTLEQKLNDIPGVRGAGLALYNPLTDNWGEGVLVAGHPPPKPGENSGASWDRVSVHYLQNLGMTIKRGRMFTEADNETTAPVAIVNEAFAKRFFKSDEDPIGQHFGLDEPQNVGTFTIVGVIRDAKFASFQLRRPAQPMFYVPLAQNVTYVKSVMTRVEYQSHFIGGLMLVTSLSPGQLEPLVTRALAEVDPNLTLLTVRTLQGQVDLSFDQDRAVASLAGLFGAVSLLLAAVGLYGVTAYAVAQRTNEIGIRMALGAGRSAVLNLVLRSAFTRVAFGLMLGVPLAIGAGRLIAAQLYGVTFWDPVALAVAAGSLTLCALVAALIPASRAAAIPPMRALRTE